MTATVQERSLCISCGSREPVSDGRGKCVECLEDETEQRDTIPDPPSWIGFELMAEDA